MIEYSNIKRYDDIAFDEYLKIEGYSQSYLKKEKNGIPAHVEVTYNMRLGSMVDAMLTEPWKVDVKSDVYEPAREIAILIKKEFGDFIDRFEKQVSFTADAECIDENSVKWVMKTKGRLDFGIPKFAVLDLKVTKDTHPNKIKELIEFMGYDNQGYSYCKGYGVKKFFLIVHFVKYKVTKLFNIDVTGRNLFWEEKICKFGIPCQ